MSFSDDVTETSCFGKNYIHFPPKRDIIIYSNVIRNNLVFAKTILLTSNPRA